MFWTRARTKDSGGGEKDDEGKNEDNSENDGSDPKSDDSGDTVIVTSTDEEEQGNMEEWRITGKTDDEESGLDSESGSGISEIEDSKIREGEQDRDLLENTKAEKEDSEVENALEEVTEVAVGVD